MSFSSLPRATIRTKLLLGYAAAFALVVAVGGFGVAQLYSINNLTKEAREVWLPKIDALNGMKAAVSEHRLLAARRVQTTSFRQLAGIGQDMRAKQAAIEAGAANYLRAPEIRSVENSVFKNFRDLWEQYLRILDTIDRRLESGEATVAYEQFEATAIPVFNRAIEQLDLLLAVVRQSSQRAEEHAQHAFDLALRMTIGISILAALIAWMATLWTSRSISLPIIRVSEAMQRLGHGDYDTGIAEHAARQDEIGVLIDAVSGYRDSLKRGRELADLAELDRQRLQAAVANMPIGLAMFDANQGLIICNTRYAEMYRLPAEVLTPGTQLKAILQERVRKGVYSGEREQFIASILTITASTEAFAHTVELNDGRTISIMGQPLAEGGWVSTHEDITERRRNEARIRHMARHDALTDLPNRVLIKEHLDQALREVTVSEPMAILCMDLDRFKAVNDSLGHPVGDRLLQAVADRVRGAIRDSDIAARFGGDEFCIVQTGVPQPEGASALGDRLIAALTAPYKIDDHQIDIGCSIGISLAPSNGDEADGLIKKADLALYRAKVDGRGVYRFFAQEMDALMQARLALELDLRRAVATGEFRLHYQPLVDIDSGEVIGVEALLRWNHARRGEIAPANFIPLAEETGLIVPIGEWVLRQACADAKGWPDDIKVAVNLSPVQFKNDGIIRVVASALAASGLAPERLELEITETVLLRDNAATLDILNRLHALGVGISLDDFGAGYSSLSYLRSFPFDKIKIDQSFVRNIGENKQSLAIVQAVTSLGATLGMIITAEGVETHDQLEHLRSQGCREVQGFYFSPPRPAAEIRALLGENKLLAGLVA